VNGTSATSASDTHCPSCSSNMARVVDRRPRILADRGDRRLDRWVFTDGDGEYALPRRIAAVVDRTWQFVLDDFQATAAPAIGGSRSRPEGSMTSKSPPMRVAPEPNSPPPSRTARRGLSRLDRYCPTVKWYSTLWVNGPARLPDPPKVTVCGPGVSGGRSR
jgi:hypothetical protein